MKKIFSVLVACATMLAVNAANTEVARLTLTAQGSPASSDVTLRVDPTVMVAETGSYYENTELAQNVNAYVLVGGNKYSSYKINSIVKLPIAIVTNRQPAGQQHYTFTFTVPTRTEGLKLKDLRTGIETDIVNAGTYEFDVNTTTDPGYADGTNYVIADRFVINFPEALDVCFIDNKLQINANPYSEEIVIKDANGDEITGSPFAASTPLVDMTAIGAAGDRFTVEFAGGARKFIIVKQ